MATRARLEESHDLSRKVFRVTERMKRDFDEIASSVGLTPLQARTILGLEKPIPMRALAHHMMCDASNVTGLADRLERLGVVERVAGEDRRVKLLSLTERGTALRLDLAKRVASGSTVTAKLTKSERAQLDTLLDRLLAD